MSSGGTWTPGFRRPPTGSVKMIGKHMVALAHIAGMTLRVLKNPPSVNKTDIADDTPTEPGDSIFFSIDKQYKKMGIDLTALTEEELDFFIEAFNIAVDRARPIIQERDKVAKEAADRGEDFYYRRHRPAPRISRIERPE